MSKITLDYKDQPLDVMDKVNDALIRVGWTFSILNLDTPGSETFELRCVEPFIEDPPPANL